MSRTRAHPYSHAASHAPGGSDPISGGSGAPTSATYVTLSTDATLTNERVLTAGHGIDLVDAGAGSTITIDVDESELNVGDATNAGVLKLGATGGAEKYLQIGPVVVTGTPSAGQTLVATSATAAAWATAGGAPTALSAYVLAPVSALSLGTDYETCKDGYIIRKPIGTFGSSDPPTNWTKDNAASGTFSSSGGVYTIANTTASASNSWYGGTHTTPAIYRLLTGVRGVIQVVHRIQITGHTTDGDSADFGFNRGSALGYIDAVVDVARTGANAFKADMWTDNGGVTATLFSGKTSAEAATGWWFRFWIDVVSGYWRLEWATGSGSVPADTAWTHGAIGRSTNMQANAIYMFAHARKAAGAGTAGVTATHWLAEERVWRLDHDAGAYIPLGGCGYTASTAVTTHDDCWVGTLGDAALNAAVQAMLTAALNQRPSDSATWEVAVMRSATAGGYGAATWTGTGAVACTGAGAFVRIQLRATGTTTQGSVQIARLPFSVTA